MGLIEDKLVLLREYFLPEVKALMCDGEDRGPRTPIELAMLAEAANNGILFVSFGAQGCIRLTLCYDVLIEKEGVDDGTKEAHWSADRMRNLVNRTILRNVLKQEILEQMPEVQTRSGTGGH